VHVFQHAHYARRPPGSEPSGSAVQAKKVTMLKNWCLYRLKRQLVNKEVTAIDDVPVLGLVNVPDSKTADTIMEALMASGMSIEADMFLDDEEGWPVAVRRQWRALKNKIEWNDLMETIAERSRGSHQGGSRLIGG
jgi:hypothetical protein